MYRVLPPLAAALMLSACSMGHVSLPFSAAKSEPSASKPSPRTALGGPERTGAPKAVLGHVERAPLATGSTATAVPAGSDALDLVNQHRIANGLKPLALSPELTRAAQRHVMDLARTGKLSHFGTDGSTPLDRVRRAGYRPRMAAENIAGGQSSMNEVIATWRASDNHNRNLLLADATHMGVAQITDPTSAHRTYWAMVLGAPQ